MQGIHMKSVSAGTIGNIALQRWTHSCRLRKTPTVSRASRMTAVCVQAFVDSADYVAVPSDYYKLLGVPRTASKESVRKTYESLVKRPANIDYSTDTLFSRAVLLKSAAECLANAETRKAYDNKLRVGYTDLRFSQPDLPGALVLLQETGEAQTVIDLATSWLEKNASSPETPDVAACLALAYCDRAAVMLQPGPTAALLPVCQDLQLALKLLQCHNRGQQLQLQISQALKDFGPQHCIELLSAAREDDAQRQQGLHLLQQVLKAAGDNKWPQTGTTLDAWLQNVRHHLTANEQVHLHSQLSRLAPGLAEDSSYDTALALIAHGFTHGLPHLIHNADILLANMPSTSDDAPYVERAVCACLLGDYRAALQLLGLPDGSTAVAQPDVQEFVLKHSGAHGNMVPGLLALSQQWLQAVALPSCRDTATYLVDGMEAWYSTPAVVLYNQVHAGSLPSAVRSILHWLMLALQHITTFVMGVSKAVTKMLATKSKQHTASSDVPNQTASVEPDDTAAPPARPWARITSPPQAGPVHDKTPVGSTTADRINYSGLIPMSKAAAANSLQAQDHQLRDITTSTKQDAAKPHEHDAGRIEQAAQATPTLLLSTLRDDGFAAAAMGDEEVLGPAATDAAGGPSASPQHKELQLRQRLVSLDHDMWDSVQAKQFKIDRPVARVLAMVAGSAALLACIWSLTSRQPVEPMQQGNAGTLSGSVVTVTPSLRKKEAEALAQSWLSAKAAALGPGHQVDALKSVLAGPQLSQWMHLARQLAAKRWHWQYQVSDLRVVAIEKLASSQALLHLFIQEAGQLVNQGSQVQDAYQLQYEMRYVVEWQNGQWMIVGSSE